MNRITDKLAQVPAIEDSAIFKIDGKGIAKLYWRKCETGDSIRVHIIGGDDLTPSEHLRVVDWLIENEEFELSDLKILSKMRDKITKNLITSDVNYKESIHE